MIKIQVSDAALLSAYIQGDDKAFETLVKRSKSKVYTTIYLIVKDRYIAEDLMQEAYIKAIDVIKSGRYNEEGKFLPWILRISHNMAIDHFRKEKRYPTIVLEDGSKVFNSFDFAEDSVEEQQMKADQVENIREMIKKLPDEQREVLVMRHYEDLSFQEIADQTGVSINTALGRMRYALINLRKMLNKQEIAYDAKLYPK
ncbi:RNA polymerase sigma factor [Aquirufa regiilacus]|jgi:RNA polymerase sigma factor (sigma-70 family)|uniref:Sigma-70 family RNA polymerase sigma factor n=1 Tax=Aquirufa regiilacus TaxID=3024868 RepID=A0ABU3TNR7_9BACT|nr:MULTISPECIES: sigma-70 family RNA polymerase sigma factor [unclassified Aquirufa]MBP6054754.1 sigma-70 family RNA polymerase sigma factor [Cytophagaceae bacterium]MBP6093171.1 sigma-70 family RNA polymerase sigma factor [Cytophagaceae bacterium]MDT8887999.1 sigma-70 family RNA polymerase sigma factor [Aquirufa sp. LEPPI-3A]MDU0807491.1 sigma-70 family RNA polymerase sigma factor [Aquirufa sp. LEOWEIH-7C]